MFWSRSEGSKGTVGEAVNRRPDEEIVCDPPPGEWDEESQTWLLPTFPGRLDGMIFGMCASNLTPEQRSEAARKAAKARWAKP